MKLTQDRALLERITQKLSNTIELPDDLQARLSNTYKVVAVGPGRITDTGYTVPPPVKVGDEVIIDKGLEVDIKGKKYTIINAGNILVIL